MKGYMKFILYIGLFLVSSCATKYIIPGNRFMTPETQGGAFRGHFEFMQASATQLAVNVKNGTVDDGVVYTDVTRSGFLFENSFFENFDAVWTHTGSSTSLLGGKFQFIGGSRTSNSAGHKMSFAALFGGNEYESDDKKVQFDLRGRELLLLYGYRLNETVLPYTSLSYATYDFDGRIKPSNLEPKFHTLSKAINTGIEITFNPFFAKLELTYQQLATDDTKDKQRFMYGYTLGFNW
jgi:hypothetical protein